jgi:hypothetical protein
MKTILLGTITVLVVLLAIIGLASFPAQPTLQGENRIESGFTNSSTTVATSTTVVLSANTGRQYARISNDTPSPVWCSLSSTTSTVNNAVRLNGIDSTTSTQPTYIELGPSTNIDYIGQVSCVGSVVGRVLILEK